MAQAILHLLDSEKGRPLQSWRFDDRSTITLGRAEDNDVVLADPYVSRSHAYLTLESGKWKLTSISRLQVIYQGQAWGELPLGEGSIFRLGPNGCFMRFGETSGAATSTQTMSFDPVLMPIFHLDRDKMEQEVSQIADAAYFKHLKETARALREQKKVEDTVV